MKFNYSEHMDVWKRLGLPPHCATFKLSMAPYTIPRIDATFYADNGKGGILLHGDVLQILARRFRLVPLDGDDLIVGEFNVDAAIAEARARIRRTIDHKANPGTGWRMRHD